MRFGILTLEDYHEDAHGSVAQLYERLVDRAVEADRLGYDGFWITEHHFHWHGGAHSAPSVALAAIAARTQRIRLGTSVTLLPFANPVRVAEEFACLDQLSGGRVELGTGRGFYPLEYDGWNIPMAESRPRFQENLEILKLAWTKDRFSFQGQFHQFRDVEVVPKPLQRPHPPIWVGASVTPESFEWIGQQGYPLMVTPYIQPSLDYLKENVQRYLAAHRSAGHKQPPEVYVFLLAYVGDDSAKVKQEVEPFVARMFAGSRAVNQKGGARDPVQYGAFNAGNQERSFDSVRRERKVLIGDRSEVREIAEFYRREINMTYLGITPSFGGMPEDLVRRTMRRIIEEIAPTFEKA